MRILPILGLWAMSGCVVAGGGGFGTDAFQELPANDASFATQLNMYRVSVGETVVEFDERLSNAAQAHAQDMVDRNYFDHESPEGLNVDDRMIAAGYNPSAFGENIAGRQTTEAEVLQSWIDSPSHKEILEGSSFEDFGLGLAVGDESRWVLVMGREDTTP